MFKLHLRTSWDFYSLFYNSETYFSRQSLSDSSVCVSNCLFKSISSSGHGGALYCTSATYFVVKSSSFFSCRTSGGYGGAIFYSNGVGQSILHEVCGYDCFTTYSSPYSQFAHIQVNNAASRKNYFNYSSITRCVNTNSDSWDALLLYGGNTFCPSVNVSLNKCYGRTIRCYPYYDSNSVTCTFSFSSFADNIAIQHTLFFSETGAKCEIKSCNILRNTQSTSSDGTIATWGNMNIEYSCILENNANYIFFQGSSYTITISNCTIDRISNNGYLTMQNTVTKSFIFAFNHMSTQHCHSEFDSVGTITHIIQLSSSSKKQMLQYSCNEFFSQSSLIDFFLLASIFSTLKLLPQ
jgi:hypothetical protein